MSSRTASIQLCTLVQPLLKDKQLVAVFGTCGCRLFHCNTSALLQTLLEGGELVELLPPDHPGIAEVKWCANRFTPFLCIDPVPAADPGARDAEEEYMDVSFRSFCMCQAASYIPVDACLGCMWQAYRGGPCCLCRCTV